MSPLRRILAATEILLVLPAALFMTALFVRNLQPVPYEPATTARHVVEWLSAHPALGLQLFLIALPFTAFVLGGATLLGSWRTTAKALAAVRAHLATLLIAGATLVAGCSLLIVFLHMAAD